MPPAAGPGTASRHYEERIFRTGEVATRPGSWHDLFNALAWLAFPQTKAVLNRRHHDELARLGDGPARGTARDVLTLFDEGGIVVACATPELAQLLGGFEWKDLFWQRRADVVRSMRFLVFGHAILERALAPYKGVTAKALILEVAGDRLDDDALVDRLDAALRRISRGQSRLPPRVRSSRCRCSGSPAGRPRTRIRSSTMTRGFSGRGAYARKRKRPREGPVWTPPGSAPGTPIAPRLAAWMPAQRLRRYSRLRKRGQRRFDRAVARFGMAAMHEFAHLLDPRRPHVDHQQHASRVDVCG